jgi:type IV secretion system protein VirB9
MIIRALVAVIFAALCFGHASAQTVPQPGPADPRIRTVLYDPNSVVSLKGHLGYQMMIEFDPQERIENVSVGDSLSWQVTPNRKATLLFVKPVARNGATNMTVVTSLRRYSFELSASEARGANDPNVIFGVRFLYGDSPDARVLELAPAPSATEAGFNPEQLNFAYSYKGSRRAAPARVFDDGRFTYFQFLPGIESPAIFVIGADGKEGLVNFQVRGRHMVVDVVAETFILRFGDEKAVVTNDAHEEQQPGPGAPRRRGSSRGQ